MLFKDPVYKEWVEPESFYSFSSNIFYEDNKNVYTDNEGVTIEAVNAHMWHGITGTGIKVKTGNETLVFSSDTINNKDLWGQLKTEKREQRYGMSKKEFENARVIYDDINNYIERTWSEEHYSEAIALFDDLFVVHDISVKDSIVHTKYEKLDNSTLKKEKSILTHSPDRITSEWLLSDADKTFKIVGDSLYDVVDGGLYTMNADVYHKEGGDYHVGYKNKDGKYTVYEKDGLLRLSADEDSETLGKPLYKVDVYVDISGKYFPKIEDDDLMYLERRDGKVELVRFTEDGSRGEIVEDQRKKLVKR